MCKAFSCIIHRNRKVYWKLAIDSHVNIYKHYNLDYRNLKREFCAIEITPRNKDYISPDEWILKFDDDCPDWWKSSHERACYSALEEWKKQLYKKIHVKRLKNIINPFKLPMVKKPTKTDINNLKEWDSVRDSVKYSFGDSWSYSVSDSVRESVVNSVGKSVAKFVAKFVVKFVAKFVWDSDWAYIGWIFNLKRNEWRYTDEIKTKGYPFMSMIKLWKRGLIPSLDGKTWRLHSGEKAKVVYEISKGKLKKLK